MSCSLFLIGNYDVLQQPKNISDASNLSVCFYMFMDEETKSQVWNSKEFNDLENIGLWRVVTVRNLPYSDPRRNGKVLFTLNFHNWDLALL